MVERERLVEDVKHYKATASVSGSYVDILYAELGIFQEDSRELATGRHWLLSQGFGCFLSAFTQSPDFKSSFERIYQAYRDMGYQAELKDGYVFSSQGIKRKRLLTTIPRPRCN
ncbi:hypothetical protein Hdeb2414_s0028g00699441 [Helianthus debilis subsp. tardiflorus]